MDTKWIKFKYSSLNKFLCALLAAVLAGLCCVSSVTVLRHISYFGGDGLINNNKVGYINTLDFAIALNEDLVTIIDDVSHNTNQAAYDAAKEATVSLAVSFVNYSRSYLEDYKDQINTYYMWENGYTNTYTEYPQLDIPYAAENYSVYAIQFDEYEDYFYFEMDVQDEALASQISFDSTDIFSKSEEELTSSATPFITITATPLQTPVNPPRWGLKTSGITRNLPTAPLQPMWRTRQRS